MSYFRVSPRDLFNEGKLLTSLGFISLGIHDGVINLNIDHENERKGYLINQDESTGDINVSNLYFYDDSGTPVYFSTGLNSRSKYPLEFEYRDYRGFVYDNNGEFTNEFRRLFL